MSLRDFGPNELMFLLMATRWTILLALITFIGGGALGFVIAALRVAPQDRVLVETDAPYLTPMPFRGRPNASYLVPLTVRAMAQTRGDDLEGLCRALDRNTEEAFGGPW